jgi:restriction system protein
MAMKITYRRIGEYLQTAFKIILDHGGSYPSRDILTEMKNMLEFTPYEEEHYEKTGYIRWQSITHLYSIDCTKAGWLKKHKGMWYVTDEGKATLNLDPEIFINTAREKYFEWKDKEGEKTKKLSLFPNSDIEPKLDRHQTATFELAQDQAIAEIKDRIFSLNPYEFQDLVAALLRGMGYFTPFIAPKGADGGVDIIAYKDPIGAQPPRIKVQVKHRRDQKVSRGEVASLNGVLRRNNDVGLIVSSSGFTQEAISEIRNATSHIEKIDVNDFIIFWDQYYDKLSDEDKNRLPLRRVSFLGAND